MNFPHVCILQYLWSCKPERDLIRVNNSHIDAVVGGGWYEPVLNQHVKSEVKQKQSTVYPTIADWRPQTHHFICNKLLHRRTFGSFFTIIRDIDDFLSIWSPSHHDCRVKNYLRWADRKRYAVSIILLVNTMGRVALCDNIFCSIRCVFQQRQKFEDARIHLSSHCALPASSTIPSISMVNKTTVQTRQLHRQRCKSGWASSCDNRNKCWQRQNCAVI